jgi:proline utilization trans-activator
VHGILKQLRAWDESLPSNLRLKDVSSPRPIASLNLAYNECIIQTTRPILLHLFNTQFHLGQTDQGPQPQTFSSITLALAESCVNAALSSSRALEALYIDGSIASFGYWDAQHNFSAALILIISAVMKPRVATSDALQTLVSILRSMKEQGNIPASEYCERLGHIQAIVSQLRNGSAPGEQEQRIHQTPPDSSLSAGIQSQMELMANSHGQSTTELGDNTLLPERHNPRANANFHYTLADPLIDSFLDQNRFVWTDASISGDPTVRDLALVEAQFYFPT